MVTSPPDRERLVFEVWYDDQQVAEISNEPSSGMRIEIYSYELGQAWSFDLTELLGLLDYGRSALSSDV